MPHVTCLLRLGALCAALSVLAPAGAAPTSYVFGGSFEAGAAGWQVAGGKVAVAPGAPDGRLALRLDGGTASQEVLGLKAGETYTVAASYRLQDVKPAGATGYAFVALYQFDEFGDTVSYRDFATGAGTSGWQRASYTFTLQPDTKEVSLRCGFYQASGTAWFDAFTLVAGEQPLAFDAVAEEGAAGLPPSARGSVAVYRDDIPCAGAPSDPDALAAALRKAGFAVALLDSAALADPVRLSPGAFDVLVLPYGPSFPVAAADNLRRFLGRGGKLLTAGGYAFDDLLERRGGRWQKPAPPPAPAREEARWRCILPAADLRGKGPLTFAGRMRCRSVSGEGFAFLAVYQYDAAGKIVAWHDICHLIGTQPWSEQRYEFAVHDAAATVELHAGLFRCRGGAWADDIRVLTAGGQALYRSDFSRPWDPDAQRPRNWFRPGPDCQVDPRGGTGGGPALQVKLDFLPQGEERLNTRFGRPADGLDVAPTQLGMFQADDRLERAVSLRRFARTRANTAAGQLLLAGKPAPAKGGYEGWAAVGVLGANEARWQPLLQACDRYGRNRGAAGALLRHYAGRWAGSTWAFFGVTNHDLFAPGGAVGPQGLVSLVAGLVSDTYVARLQSDPPCAGAGETVTLRALVFNGGRHERRLQARFTVVAEGGRPVLAGRQDVDALPGQGTEVAAAWKVPPGSPAFVRLRCDLLDAGRRVDVIEGGVVVRSPAAVAKGPQLSLRANQLCIGGVPRFLFGTDDWSYVFNSDAETPAQWRFDAAERRDYGVQLYENLQVGMPATPAAREAFLRKLDGVVQLAQQHGQVYFAGLLVGANVAVDDAELARQAEWCGAFARRYRSVPGLIYYLNGDLRCQLSAAVTPQWNRFLRERYGSDDALRAAWGPRAPAQKLGEIPAGEYLETAWDDVRAYDTNLFRAWLIRRWTGALIKAIRAEDPKALTSCEFYQLPHEGIDVPEGIGDLDLSNIGYFDRPLEDVRRFPALLKLSDQRARGKSLGPGEYGVKTHPAWGDGKDYGYHTARTPQQALDLFLAVPHYTLGLGGSRIHNWCWKDSAQRVFPWGMAYPCDGVPKEILLAHRAQSLLFRQFAPVYRTPQVYLLTPDSHRLGGQKYRVIEGLVQSADLALAAHVDNLGVLNERNLTEIPPEAKVIYYPLPYCPSDAAYAKLLAWVRAGGTLYLSGDISYDEQRRRTRAARLEELCGARFMSELYPNISYGERPAVPLAVFADAASANRKEGWAFSPAQPGMRLEAAGAQVLATAPDGSPVAFLHAVGKGRVLFLAEPLELHPNAKTRATDAALYRKVLELAGVRPLPLAPDDPAIHLFRVPLQDGGSVWVVFNADETQLRRRVTLPGIAPAVTLTLDRQRPGLVWVDGKGRLRAVEAAGSVQAGGRPLLECAGQTILYSADGEDLRRSRAVVLLPLAPGAVRIAGAAWASRSAGAAPADTAVVVGEVREGTWRAYETLPVKAGALTVPPDAAGCILLVGERARLGAAGVGVVR